MRKLVLGFLAGLCVGLLAGGMVASFLLATTPAPALALTQMPALIFAIDMFQYDAGRPPTAAEGLAILKQCQPRGPYLREIPVDPWGRACVYKFAADGTPIVATLGRDGLPGGTGEDTDLELYVKLRMPLPAAFTNTAPPASQPIPEIVPSDAP